MLSDKQKASREKALGSSDAPIVAGVSRYSSPLELYHKLRGDLPRYDDNETWEQKAGNKFEPVIAEIVAEELNLKIRRVAPRTHPVHAWMTANLDFEIVNHPNGPGVLEIKRRSGERFHELPDDIALQVAHQMAVTNRNWGKVAVLFGWGKPVVFDVERDREVEEYLIELEARFMVRVEKGEAPTEAWTPETVDLLKKLYPSDRGTTIALPSEEATKVANAFLYYKEQVEVMEGLKSEHEGWLKDHLKDAAIGVTPGYQVSWKTTKPGKKFDLERFKAENPAVYAKYETTKPGHRVFRVTPTKELK